MASSSAHTAPTFGSAAAAPPNQSPCPSINRDASGARFIVVMGVSGTGKSTLGAALARAMHLPFIDGDDLHPAVNVAKMSRGEPLDDADRSPWLDTIRGTAVASVLGQLDEQPGVDPEVAGGPKTEDPAGARAGAGVVVACSSLKKTYRAVLRGDPGVFSRPCATSLPTYFVYLKGDQDVLMARMRDRKGHFMKAGMLESQLRTLESPEGEPGVVSVSVEMSTAEQVQRVLELLGSLWS
ncbi:P-loop containing nucleoside triphosphate hydrolase protein [Boletus coccyginus]|nr:P-loop containing nucleoside triphosphate hydrolase protein [Boletus coccyginus]